MSLPSQDLLTFPPAPPERCPQLSNFLCLHPISKVTHPWPHSKGACLVLASHTNSRLVASAQRTGSKGPGTVSGCGCAGRCVCWARFCTSQSRSILPGVRHLGASPCSVSHMVGFLCGPFRASVSLSFSWTKKCPGPLCFPLLGLLWFPVPRCMSVFCQLWPAPSKGDYREPYPYTPCTCAWLVWCGSCAMHVCVLGLSCHVRLFATPWTLARQAPLSMGFSRQEY